MPSSGGVAVQRDPTKVAESGSPQGLTASTGHHAQRYPTESASLYPQIQPTSEVSLEQFEKAPVYTQASTSHIGVEGTYVPTSTPQGATGLQVQSFRGREELSHNVQEVIEEINNKRKGDTNRLSDFKTALEMHIQKACSMVEQNMFDMYEQQSAIVQDKLQEFFTTLDRVATLEAELAQFKMALGSFYKDVA